jgi:alpha,alpha-trehalase
MRLHSLEIFRSRLTLALVLFCTAISQANCLQSGNASSGPAQEPGLAPILNYISSAWDSLTRSMSECGSVVDPKVQAAAVLYLPADFPESASLQKLSSQCKVRIEHLPIVIHQLGEIDTSKIQPPGLLYLENKYVVPGGRFNEMYGWDSYFIIRGLLDSGHIDLARGMAENFFFEVEHYGAMLNANRTYYLTRSQPPFLSSMVVEVYAAMRKSGSADPAWLKRAYADLEKDYGMWNRAPHLAGDTGLSRYYDFGEGPPTEAAQDESGSYRKVAAYFLLHPGEADHYIVPNTALNSIPMPTGSGAPVGPVYIFHVCGGPFPNAATNCDQSSLTLSADYYKGDRSMRESGFDVSSRFGAFGAATHHYAPVCLNTLLYKTEKDMEQISRWLGHDADAAQWHERAEKRKQLINRYFWDENAGLFFDYDFTAGQRSPCLYATTFYPLWAGLATAEQGKAVAKNLAAFEKPGGLAMSTTDTGAQWDLPYGWGNIEMLAVEGLRRYGFNSDADRISYEFLSMVAENFRRDGYIVEKYNVVERSSEAHLEMGYKMNVVGFGWTNAAFLELLHELPKSLADRLAAEQDRPVSQKTE